MTAPAATTTRPDGKPMRCPCGKALVTDPATGKLTCPDVIAGKSPGKFPTPVQEAEIRGLPEPKLRTGRCVEALPVTLADACDIVIVSGPYDTLEEAEAACASDGLCTTYAVSGFDTLTRVGMTLVWTGGNFTLTATDVGGGLFSWVLENPTDFPGCSWVDNTWDGTGCKTLGEVNACGGPTELEVCCV